MNLKQKTELFNKFYFDKDTGLPDLNNYGMYRLGLTAMEVKDYILVRAIQKQYVADDRLVNKFYDVAGCNTCASIEDIPGNRISLMYRWDVQRYADLLFKGTPTYFD